MKKTTEILITCVCLLVSGCNDYTTHVHIEKDGSGKVMMEFDASALFAMAALSATGDSVTKVDPLNAEVFIGALVATGRDIDTTISFSEMLTDSTASLVDRPELLESASMQIKVNQSSGEGRLLFRTDFSNEDEYWAIQEALGQINATETMESEGLNNIEFDGPFSGGRISVARQLVSGTLGETSTNTEELDEAQRAFLEEMIGDAQVIVRYHLPGKVLTVTDSIVTVVDDYTAQVTLTAVDMIIGGAMPAYTITYDTSEMTNK